MDKLAELTKQRYLQLQSDIRFYYDHKFAICALDGSSENEYYSECMYYDEVPRDDKYRCCEADEDGNLPENCKFYMPNEQGLEYYRKRRDHLEILYVAVRALEENLKPKIKKIVSGNPLKMKDEFEHLLIAEGFQKNDSEKWFIVMGKEKIYSDIDLFFEKLTLGVRNECLGARTSA